MLPHERTLSGAEGGPLQAAAGDRRQHEPGRRPVRGPGGSARPARRLAALTGGQPDVDVTDDDGVRHRLWAVPADGDAADAVARAHWPRPARGRSTIADGHHRYETALRYRDERRMSRSCEEDPAFDYLLMLFLPDRTGEPLTVLPTHRLVRGLDDDGRRPASSTRADELFEVERERVRGRAPRPSSRPPGSPPAARAGSGCGRGPAARRLTARREAFEPFLPAGGAALRDLDVVAARRRPRAAARHRRRTRSRPARSTYTKSAAEAIDARRRAAPTAPTPRSCSSRRPVASIVAVAARRRRHAPEVDLLLPEGPDRPRHQPARMVSPLPDQTPDADPRPGPAAADQRPAGPQGRDRAPRSRALHRVLAAGAPLPAQAAAVRPRRAHRLVALGALPRLLRRARLGGPRPQPAQPLLVADRGPGAALVRHLHRGRRRRARAARPERRWSSVTGWAACSALKAAERMPIVGHRPAQPGAAARAAPAGPPVRAARDPGGLRPLDDRLGDAPRAAAARPSRPDARRRPAHPAPARPEAARGRARPAARCWPACRSTGAASRPCRAWSSAAVSTGPCPLDDAERLADWLDAELRAVRRRTRTTGWSSARRATSRSPTPSAGSWRPTGSRVRPAVRRAVVWYHPDPARAARRPRHECRIRLEAQDTALSRRRSPVRIRYAVPPHRRCPRSRVFSTDRVRSVPGSGPTGTYGRPAFGRTLMSWSKSRMGPCHRRKGSS